MASAETDKNPWRELTVATRELLVPLLAVPADPALKDVRADPEFDAWYHRYYCPAFPLGDWQDCSAQAVAPELAYAEFRYNALALPARVTVACLTTVFQARGLYDALIDPSQKAAVIYADQRGSIILRIGSPLKFRDALVWKGFVSDFCAGPSLPGQLAPLYCLENQTDAKAKLWGLRDQNPGPGLHWYQTYELALRSQISAHIDYDGPGQVDGRDPGSSLVRGLIHAYNDKLHWNERNLGMMLESSPDGARCGVGPTEALMAALEDRCASGSPAPVCQAE